MTSVLQQSICFTHDARSWGSSDMCREPIAHHLLHPRAKHVGVGEETWQSFSSGRERGQTGSMKKADALR
jgi:hypothetical protein